MTEIAKRLAPTKDTLRKLYLRSGNQCAFPKCENLIINSDGDFTGQICHIEAAEKGGERFNPKQTNEDRRNFENLMLLCYEHHIKTNDVTVYTVEKMQTMKRNHEAKFGDIARTIRNSVSDHTEVTGCTYPHTLKRFIEILSWNMGREEVKDTLEEIVEFADRVRALPIPTREFLSVVINRAKRVNGSHSEIGVSVGEIQLSCDLDNTALNKHIQVLDSHGFIMEGDPWDFLGGPGIVLRQTSNGWVIAEDLQIFCNSTDITLRDILVDLKFELLD